MGIFKEHLNRARFNWRGVEFLGYGSRQVTAYESVIIRDRLGVGGTSMFSVDVWGTCFYATQITVEEQNVAGVNMTGIHRSMVNGFVVAFLLHAAKMLKSLGYFGSLIIRVNLRTIRGIPWLYGTGSAVFDKLGSELDQDISFESPEVSELFYSDPYALAARILETIYFSSNWGDQVDTPAKLQSVVNESFMYSNWPAGYAPKP